MGFGDVLREFGVKISLDFDKKKVDAAQTAIEGLGKKMRSFAFDVSAISAALFESQNLFTTNARSIEDQSEILGISTRALQEYEYAAKVGANVNREELVGSFQKLADTMDLARAGVPEATQAIYQLGEAAGFGGGNLLNKMRDPAFKVTDAMNVMADGIKKMSAYSPQAAARLAEFALGNTKLIPLLKQGGAAVKALAEEGGRNFAMTDAQIKQGKEMDVQMTKLWLLFRKIGYEIGYGVMKYIGPLAKEFAKWLDVNKKLIVQDVVKFLKVLGQVMVVIWREAIQIGRQLAPVIDYLGGVENATKLVIGAFLAWKAIGVGLTMYEAGMGIAKMIGPLQLLAPTLMGVGSAFKAFALVSTLPDMLPALQLFGSGAAAALAPFLASCLALAPALLAIEEGVNMFAGKETLVQKLMYGITGGWGESSGPSAPYSGKIPLPAIPGSAPSARIPGGAGSAPVNQINHFNSTMNVEVPAGTPPSLASAIITKAHVDSNSQMLRAAQASSARTQVH